MPRFPLVRERHTVDVFDADATRAWLCALVRQEVRLRGEPRPRLLAVGDGVFYTVDLSEVSARDPGASVGLTLAALAARLDVHRVFLVARMEAEDAAGAAHEAAFVLERGDDGRFWGASLPYRVDPGSGVGDPEAVWRSAESESPPPFLTELLAIHPGSRAAELDLPRAPEPDIRAAFGELPAHLPLPSDAVQQSELTAAMVVGEIVREGLTGVIVLRLAGRDWEWWVLGDGLPTDLDDMVRVICARSPEPDGVALVQLARLDGPEPGVGVQIIAEHGGKRAERWVLLEFPHGPRGPRSVGKVLARALPPPGEEGWIGVAPVVDFDLAAIGPAAEG